MADPKSSEITSRPPLVGFIREDAATPGLVYIGRNDRLFIRSHSSEKTEGYALGGRLLRPDGEIVPFLLTHTSADSTDKAVQAFELAEGWLLSVTVTPVGTTPPYGQNFCEVGILRGRTADQQVLKVLVRDYVTTALSLGWPGGRQIASVDGPGNIRALVSADPVAGAELTATVGADQVWRLVAVRITLVTSAVAGNRFPRLELFDGTNVLWRSHPHDAHPASTTRTYNWARGSDFVAAVAAGEHQNVIPDVRLFGGWLFRTSTDGIDAGDNYGTAAVTIESWVQD